MSTEIPTELQYTIPADFPNLSMMPAYVPDPHYVCQRRAEYPPITDQLDALWKGGDAAAEMLARVQAVKDKYPKSE